MTTTTHTHDVRPITSEALVELRSRDDAGRAPRAVVDDGGCPLRCCLRRSTGGEAVVLVAYAPLRRWARQTGAEPGPYDEVGPVFIHAGPCDGPLSPALFDGRRVLRAYDAAGSILGGRLVDADEDIDALLSERLADPTVALMHVRFAEFGCFIAAVHRDRARTDRFASENGAIVHDRGKG